MMKQSLVLFLLASLVPAQAWHANESSNDYVAYPAEVQTRLTNEYAVYHAETFPLPVLRAYDTFPVATNKDTIWDLLKSMNTRLHPILWPRAQYWVMEGIEFGCRIAQPDGTSLPNTTDHCNRHCLNQGRYCLPHPDNADLRYGRDSVKEIIRRLCMDEIYHAKDPRFIAYLEEFDAQNCFNLELGVRECAINAMHTVGMHWTEIAACAAEADYEKDVSNVILNRNMRHVTKEELKTVPLPAVTIDGKPVNPLQTSSIFQDYCNAFPSYLQMPLACHICKDCGNVRECLWNLKCDGAAFQAENVHDDILGANLAPADGAQNIVDTVAPTEEFVDNFNDDKVAPTDGTGSVVDGTDQVMELPETQTVGFLDNSDNSKNKNDGAPPKKHKGLLVMAILLILAAASVAGLFLYRQTEMWREGRAKQLLADIANGKYNRNSQGLYKDDEELGGRAREVDENPHAPASDYRGRAQQLLDEINNGSISKDSFRDLRQRDMDNSTASTVQADVYGDDGVASDDEKEELDDIKVEDMLEEESEWAEQKRFSGQAIPAAAMLC